MNDPAVLFYTSDFLTGVIDMTMEERGQYITLLCNQHQKGHISIETIRLLVGSVSDNVLKHFKIDENGNYFNNRMEKEKMARRNFTESRRKNGKKGGRPKKPSGYPNGKPKKNHMGNEDENENENDNDNENININKILNLYINTINSNISSIEYEKLEYYFNIFKDDLKVIEYAIEYCKLYKVFNFNYFSKILDNWIKAGYKTLEQIKNHEKKYQEEREQKIEDDWDYNWLEGDDSYD